MLKVKIIVACLLGFAIAASPLAASAYTTTQADQLVAAGFTSPTKTKYAGTDWLYKKTTAGGCKILVEQSSNLNRYYVVSYGAKYNYAYPVASVDVVPTAIAFANACQ